MIISITLLLLLSLVIVLFLYLGRPRFIHDAGSYKLIVGLPQLGRTPRGERLERCKQSPQWHDGQFRNETPMPVMTNNEGFLKSLRKHLLTKYPDTRPDSTLHVVKTDLRALPPQQDLVVWFGHSSCYVQLGGRKILVDPVFHTASPVNFTTKPFDGTDVYKPEDMPDIDLLIITHNHYDHLDYETVRQLRSRIKQIVCPLGVGEALVAWGCKSQQVIEMDWWEEAHPLDGMTVACTPSRHFSGRQLHDRNKTLWASFVVLQGERRLYFSGDGGYDSHFRRIGEKYGPFDVAFMENGQYNEQWATIHTMPREMRQACTEINAKQIFSIHHGKFSLSQHPWTEPYDNVDTLQQQGIAILPNKIGEVVKI